VDAQHINTGRHQVSIQDLRDPASHKKTGWVGGLGPDLDSHGSRTDEELTT